MIALTVIIYILGILTAFLLLLGLIIMVVPIRYRVEGGYDNQPWFLFTIRCSQALVFSGSWGEKENAPFQAIFKLFGIPLKIDPKKFSKTESDKKYKKKKAEKSIFSRLFIVLDRELQSRGIALVKELFQILKPDLLNFKGRIGFDEPHLTGWLVAVTNTLKYGFKQIFIELEPVWDDEYYQFEAIIQGHIRVGVILVKVGWFILVLKAGHLIRKKSLNYKSNCNLM